MKKKIVYAYIGLTFLLFADLVSYLKWDISLRGFWADRILFWIWLIATILTILYFRENRITKMYAFSLIGLIVLSLLPMAIPFITLIGFATGSRSGCEFQLNSEYRIEEYIKSPIAMPEIHLIKAIGICERIVEKREFELDVHDEYYRMCDAESIEITDDSGDGVDVRLKFKNGTFEWKIN